jgi:hypothetical protein
MRADALSTPSLCKYALYEGFVRREQASLFVPGPRCLLRREGGARYGVHRKPLCLQPAHLASDRVPVTGCVLLWRARWPFRADGIATRRFNDAQHAAHALIRQRLETSQVNVTAREENAYSFTARDRLLAGRALHGHDAPLAHAPRPIRTETLFSFLPLCHRSPS